MRLITPQFVKPYVKSNKNDANDAEAICEAMSRPSILCPGAGQTVPVAEQELMAANIPFKLQYQISLFCNS